MKPICVIGEDICQRYGLVMTTSEGFKPGRQPSVRSLRNWLVVSLVYVAATVVLLAVDLFSRPIIGENVLVASILVLVGLALASTQWSRSRRARSVEAEAADYPDEQDR
jgi:undecaprenyl pyrophosphate phosphatase UppP